MRFLNAAKLEDNLIYFGRNTRVMEHCKKMNYVLANVQRGEAENYWHDAMSRLRLVLGSAVKTSGGQER